jgi:DNA-binding transcriptional MerR regulator
MTDWKDIHPDFTDELQAHWEQSGFNIEEIKKWIDAGLEPDESGLAVYIMEFVFKSEDFDINNIDEIKESMEEWNELLDEKREEYYEDNERVIKKRRTSLPERDWTDIDSKFTPELVQEWKNCGFDWEETHDWINIGMKTTDAGFCAWLRDEVKVDSDWVLNYEYIEELQDQYQQYLLVAQQIQTDH